MARRINIFSLGFIACLLPFSGFAASAPAAEKSAYDFNPVLIGLISFIIILLFAIGILGNVLKQLAFVYRDKMREHRNGKGITKIVLLLLAISIPAAYVQAQTVATPTVETPIYISGIEAVAYYWLVGTIILELLVIISMTIVMKVLVRSLSNRPETAAKVNAIVRRPFWDRFNKIVPIEKEQDIMLDHNYDGIRELDNNLPPWWIYGFYVTIIVAFIYMYYYHIGGGGPSSYQEYVAEVEQGETDKAAYLSKTSNNVDENTIVMLDAAGIAEGQTIFQNTCAACHMKDGGGGVGPNLTDDYWLHGGGIKDVFKSIKYGWADKGMKSWKDDFSPKQLAQLTSFVKSLKGTKPAAPKDKQGELYNEANTPAKDSVKTLATN